VCYARVLIKARCLKALTSKIILSCEHGGNRIPPEYRYLFNKAARTLDTHRGLDIGALAVATALAQRLDVPLTFAQTSRLLVDLNRSPHHPRLFSEFTRACDRKTRMNILQEYYHPYRNKLEQKIQNAVTKQYSVLHLSIHSFTPRLGTKVRHADIGLLYDPSRTEEKIFCKRLQTLLNESSELVTRLNYPYRGNADGLTTWFRKKFQPDDYAGIEIEINQKLIAGSTNARGKLAGLICSSIRTAIETSNT